MLKVGLTGGMGAGKSTVSGMFEMLGATVIDADLIAKALTEKGQPAALHIIDHFGSVITDRPEEINRKKLKELIFSNPSEKKWLEEYLHPLILKTMKAQSEQAKSPYAILVIPLLQETRTSHALVDRVLVIDTPMHLQLKRIQARDHLNEQEAKKILNTQAHAKERLAIADDVICNDNGKNKLQTQVDRLHTLYLELAEKKSVC